MHRFEFEARLVYTASPRLAGLYSETSSTERKQKRENYARYFIGTDGERPWISGSQPSNTEDCST